MKPVEATGDCIYASNRTIRCLEVLREILHSLPFPGTLMLALRGGCDWKMGTDSFSG